MTRIIFAVSAIALMGLPMAAHAQSASSTVTISGEVEQACTLGAHSAAELNLGDITGADGRLAPGLAQSTTIAVAWCNTPSEMTLAAEPLSLVTPPGYTTPTGFSRLITYDATVGGWAEALAHRPLVGDLSNSVTASTPWAADPLEISISSLATLNADGSAEAPTAFVEAGEYTATVTISLAIQ